MQILKHKLGGSYNVEFCMIPLGDITYVSHHLTFERKIIGAMSTIFDNSSQVKNFIDHAKSRFSSIRQPKQQIDNFMSGTANSPQKLSMSTKRTN